MRWENGENEKESESGGRGDGENRARSRLGTLLHVSVVVCALCTCEGLEVTGEFVFACEWITRVACLNDIIINIVYHIDNNKWKKTPRARTNSRTHTRARAVA